MDIPLELGTINSYKSANQLSLFHFNFLEVGHFVLHTKMSIQNYFKQFNRLNWEIPILCKK